MTVLATEISRGELGGTRAAGIGTWIARYLSRRHFRRLLALEDRMLDDIGVTRDEVEYACRLPLSVNAAIELRRLAHRRRARARGFGEIRRR